VAGIRIADGLTCCVEHWEEQRLLLRSATSAAERQDAKLSAGSSERAHALGGDPGMSVEVISSPLAVAAASDKAPATDTATWDRRDPWCQASWVPLDAPGEAAHDAALTADLQCSSACGARPS